MINSLFIINSSGWVEHSLQLISRIFWQTWVSFSNQISLAISKYQFFSFVLVEINFFFFYHRQKLYDWIFHHFLAMFLWRNIGRVQSLDRSVIISSISNVVFCLRKTHHRLLLLLIIISLVYTDAACFLLPYALQKVN